VSAKPLASVSLDLDNQWSYMKTHGDAGWESFPSYLDVFVPYALEALDALGLTITFFVVGQDASLDRNRAPLRALAGTRHDVGNHSFHHEQWMHTFSRDRIKRDIVESGEAIERATGRRPSGFRGPGFTWSETMLEVLEGEGYVYDASTLPTYLGPLARRYYFRHSSLSMEEMEKRKDLFGGFGEGRRPVKPYLWRLSSGKTLLEIPVTTVPGIKTPFHLSYLLHLSRYSMRLMSAYLDTALRLCLLTGTEPSFLLHPLDLMGPEQAPQLAFFPGMDIAAPRKLEVWNRVLQELGRRFQLVTLGDHAKRILERSLPVRTPRGGTSPGGAAHA
jgi:peptidoglycan-N-acetylglucosamine deacetylase